MKECLACGGAVKMGMFGDECIVCGVAEHSHPAPCVHGEFAAGRPRCVAASVPREKRAPVAELLASTGCPMDSSCPGFDERVDYEPFESRVARISSGGGYGFDDADALSLSKQIVAARLGKNVDSISDVEWMSVAHVYDGIKKDGAGLFRTLKQIIDMRREEKWCMFLHGGKCLQPVFDYEHGDETWDLDSVRYVNLGDCPYVNDWGEQARCDISHPDPSIPKDYLGSFDKAAERQVTSHWNDVRQKAVRLRRDGRVTLIRNEPNIIVAKVRGDNDIYDVVIYRQESGGKLTVTTHECSCAWGDWAWNRVKYFGRMCSHQYAALMEAQSQLMSGPGSELWQHKFDKAAVVEVSDMRCAYCGSQSNLIDELYTGASVCSDCHSDILAVAASSVLRGDTLGEAYKVLRANLGDSADDYLADYQEDARVSLDDGGTVEVVSHSKDGRYSYVIVGGKKRLVPSSSLVVTAQKLSPLRGDIQRAIEREVGESVSAVTVRFSPHWSRRVEGDFLLFGETHSYEYTKSTGRLVIKDRQLAPFDGKMASEESPVIYEDEMDELRELIAAENPDFAQFSKTATRQFSMSEQDSLIREGEGAIARNAGDIRTDGSHLSPVDDEFDDSSFFL